MMTMLGDCTDSAPDPSCALNAVRSPPRRAPPLPELTRDGLCSNRICGVTSSEKTPLSHVEQDEEYAVLSRYIWRISHLTWRFLACYPYLRRR